MREPQKIGLPGKLRPAPAIIVLIMALWACATGSKLLDFTPCEGLSARNEWGMHKAGVEWWYLSGKVADSTGHVYFFQYTLFHGMRLTFQGHSVHLAVSDLDNGRHYFEEENYVPSGKISTSSSLIRCQNSFIERNGDSIHLFARGDSTGLDLSMEILQDAIWHGSHGMISMGDTSDRGQDSYYYSFPSLSVNGTLSLPDPGDPGRWREIHVTGDAWFDKQWGDFKPVPWVWASVRFNDGGRAMLFYFPGSGHKEGTLIPTDGRAAAFTAFSVETVEDNGNGAMKWKVNLHGQQAGFFLEPYLDIPFHATRFGITYWEGLCRLLDENGNEEGWAVVEVNR